MLLSFRTENVRSFREPMEISFLATTLADPAAVRQVSWRQGGSPIGVLPVACVFGANASGKSNVLRAMDDMRSAVLRSFRSWSPTGGTERRPFRLDRQSPERPSRFEVDLILAGVRHEYGFIVDDESVVQEWATRYPKGRAAQIFHRDQSGIVWGASVAAAKSRAVTDLVRPNALVLSTAAAAAHRDLTPVYDWFQRNLNLADAESRPSRHAFSAHLLTHADTKQQVMALLQAADLGIVGISEEPVDRETKERLERAIRVLTDREESEPAPDIDMLGLSALRLHHAGDGVEGVFTPSDESMGTLVWLGLAGPIVQALASGSVLLADELDTSLHPALTAQIVKMFQSPQTNPRRAQLIFNSHDATLLGEPAGRRLLGRDQIWFAEKRNDGASVLYPLSDLDPRKDEAIERRYLAGRYGGNPILADGDFEAAVELVLAGSDQ